MRYALSFWILFCLGSSSGIAQRNGDVRTEVLIQGLPGSAGTLFGVSVTNLGDVDGDGIDDLAVGASADPEGLPPGSGSTLGAVWILFMERDGTVRAHQKISQAQGGFIGPIANDGAFGQTVTGLGDLDDDGVPDLAVGAPEEDGGAPPGGSDFGAVWILFLKTDGTVKAEQKIDSVNGGVTGLQLNGDFGSGLAGVGDLNGDTIEDLIVGASGYSLPPLGQREGALYSLLLNADGTVQSQVFISDFLGGLFYNLDNNDELGSSLSPFPDSNGDGRPELLVGVFGEEVLGETGTKHGRLLQCDLDSDGRVGGTRVVLIPPRDTERLGTAAACVADVDGDGNPEILGGASFADGAGDVNDGSITLVLLGDDATGKSFQRIDDSEGGLAGPLVSGDKFGEAATGIGDLDLDGVGDLAVGAPGADAVYVLFLEGCDPVSLTSLDPRSGAEIGATSVTLTGSGFTTVPDTTVTFDGVAASVLSVTSTEIVVTTPSGTGGERVDVEVINGGGSCRMSLAYTYSVCDSFSISRVAPEQGAERGNNQVQIQAANFDQGFYRIFFGVEEATVVGLTTTNRILVRTPPGTGTVDVRLVNACGEASLANGFTYLPDPIAARYGNIGEGGSFTVPQNALFLNGGAGDVNRKVCIGVDEPILLETHGDPLPFSANYAFWVWAGEPTPSTVYDAPSDIGLFAMTPPFGGGSPAKTWNNIGFFRFLNSPDFSSPFAPATILDIPGISQPITVTFQGILPGGRSEEAPFYVTNAIVLKIQ